MEHKIEKALITFRSGYNCAQSVLIAYSEQLKFDNGLALSISTGFGGGMGRLQETCGAVTGAFMVLGVHNCRKYADNGDRKNKTYAMVQDFDRKFKALHKTTSCKELLGCDLKTPDGHKIFNENKLVETVCEKCITNSINILDELMA